MNLMGTQGSLKYYENRDPGPHFSMKMGTWVPNLGGPYFHMTLVSYPAPRGEGSGDIGTISWLHRRVISCQYYAINHAPVPRCYAMQRTIKETAFSLASAKPPARHCTIVAARPDARSHENRGAAI